MGEGGRGATGTLKAGAVESNVGAHTDVVGGGGAATARVIVDIGAVNDIEESTLLEGEKEVPV